LKPSQNSLFKADTCVKPIDESGILGLVLVTYVQIVNKSGLYNVFLQATSVPGAVGNPSARGLASPIITVSNVCIQGMEWFLAGGLAAQFLKSGLSVLLELGYSMSQFWSGSLAV
jgi:hypothetical protein